MKQRIGLAQSLINDPKLLFLDEPTGGLDPIAHREIRDLILSFRDEGRTVFISSHELSEVELICDRVAIIDRGIVKSQGKLTELLKGGRIEITVEGVESSLLSNMNLADSNVRTLPNGLMLDIPEENDVNAVIDSVRTSKGRIVSIVPRRKRLEDLFVETVSTKPRVTVGVDDGTGAAN